MSQNTQVEFLKMVFRTYQARNGLNHGIYNDRARLLLDFYKKGPGRFKTLPATVYCDTDIAQLVKFLMKSEDPDVSLIETVTCEKKCNFRRNLLPVVSIDGTKISSAKMKENFLKLIELGDRTCAKEECQRKETVEYSLGKNFLTLTKKKNIYILQKIESYIKCKNKFSRRIHSH